MNVTPTGTTDTLAARVAAEVRKTAGMPARPVGHPGDQSDELYGTLRTIIERPGTFTWLEYFMMSELWERIAIAGGPEDAPSWAVVAALVAADRNRMDGRELYFRTRQARMVGAGDL